MGEQRARLTSPRACPSTKDAMACGGIQPMRPSPRHHIWLSSRWGEGTHRPRVWLRSKHSNTDEEDATQSVYDVTGGRGVGATVPWAQYTTVKERTLLLSP